MNYHQDNSLLVDADRIVSDFPGNNELPSRQLIARALCC